jgi:hypothetical protein
MTRRLERQRRKELTGMDRMNRIRVLSFQFSDLKFKISNPKSEIANQTFSYPAHPVHPC